MIGRDPDVVPTASELAACAADVRAVRCAELATWLAEGRACSILDVRTAGADDNDGRIRRFADFASEIQSRCTG